MSATSPSPSMDISINRELFERLDDVVFVHDVNERFLYISPAVERLLGYPLAAAADLTFSQIIVQEFVAEARRRTEQQARHEAVDQPWDLQVYNKAGEKVWVQIVTSPVYDSQNRLTQVIGVARDIQRQKQLEQQVQAKNEALSQLLDERGHSLERSEEKYRQLVEEIGDIIYVMDPTGRLVYVSPAIQTVLGYSPAEAMGRSFLDFVHEDDHAAIHKRVGEVLAGKLGPEEYRFRNRSGETRWLRTSGRPFVKDGVAVGLRGVLVDVTESKQLQDQLRQWQKLEAVGTLAGGVAHEFNNILTAIVGHAEMIHMGEPHLADDEVQDLQAILVAAKRAKDLVRQILTFSRQTELEMAPVQLGSVVRETASFLRASLPTTIEIRQQIDEQAGLVVADVTQMRQVLLNLGANAAFAMREAGGTLQVELAAVDSSPDPPAAGLPPTTSRGYIRLTVTDTGHGMAAETLEQIFDPFFTTKKPGEGTGMGLAVVHGIVQSHGGTIDVRSEPDKGTTVEILLPRLDMTATEPTQRGRPSLTRGTGRILFIDDEAVLVRTAIKLFSRLGYDVLGASGGPEALAIARDPKQSLDLVITDQTMPQMTGLEVARELKRIRPELPVILCTGYQDDEGLQHARDPAIDALVTKPYDPAQVAGMVRDMLSARRASA